MALRRLRRVKSVYDSADIIRSNHRSGLADSFQPCPGRTLGQAAAGSGKISAVDVRRMIHAAVYGWYRTPVVSFLERALPRRPVAAEDVRAIAGLLFLFWSTRRIVRALGAGLRA